MKRRAFLKQTLLTTPIIISGVQIIRCKSNKTDYVQDLLNDGYVSIFDGKTLNGWHSESRLPIARYPGGPESNKESEAYQRALTSKGLWTVEDGAIVGGQDPPGSGLGGYLVSDQEFGDFELVLDIKPDWPVDSGVYLRAGSAGIPGIQVLVDHRKSGGIGGFYGNGLAGFHAIAYGLDAKYDENGNAIGLIPEVPETTVEPVTDAKKKLLVYAAPVEEFLATWKWADWNNFKIRCEGKYAYVTTWINGVKIAELDTAKIVWPNYDKEEIYNQLGSRGHISFEVHDNDRLLGENRWRPGAVCRWKNIFIKEFA